MTDYFFRSNECKSPGDVADVGIFMMSEVWYRNDHDNELPQVATFIGGIYELEWSEDTQIISPILAAFSKINN